MIYYDNNIWLIAQVDNIKIQTLMMLLMDDKCILKTIIC